MSQFQMKVVRCPYTVTRIDKNSISEASELSVLVLYLFVVIRIIMELLYLFIQLNFFIIEAKAKRNA
ncbi:hypothetical protein H5410_027962 [Solanum commersonii]|uniref:Uncharacterized protein n=1 Tax=Solanum commersonii TaxID=4109 RepID=A0A9J5Z624_SOLCO|nr:hypothetical protein H5410_027962 [Solanum commersonii]